MSATQSTPAFSPCAAAKSASKLGQSFSAQDNRADNGARRVRLDAAGVEISRAYRGIAMRIGVPMEHYRGIALRLVKDSEGFGVYRIDLLHEDMDLSVEVETTTQEAYAMRLWADLAEDLSLPRLVERQRDVFCLADDHRFETQRDSRLLTRERHGNFQLRRKIGVNPSLASVHREDEIISYE